MILQTTKNNWEQPLYRLAQAAFEASSHAAQPAKQQSNAEELQKANQVCEEITAYHSRSFHLATRLLPSGKRQAMRALYAFCRTADDLADDNLEDPETRLKQLREGISTGIYPANDAVLLAWHDIAARFHIPVTFARQLLDGVERDLVQRRYETFEDLSVYCYNVASTVGLMSMHITGFTSPEAIPYAIKLGVALQLTNILRDVGEDWSAGRLYLPEEELNAFGLSEGDIASQAADKRWRAFMQFQIDRARGLYAEALPGIRFLHPDGRFAVAAAAHLYRGILNDIERHDYAVFNRRAHVNRRKKLGLLLNSFWFSQTLGLRQFSYQYVENNSTEGNYGF